MGFDDPNQTGSNDESSSGDDLHPTYESQAASPSGDSSDPDATIESIERGSKQDAESNPVKPKPVKPNPGDPNPVDPKSADPKSADVQHDAQTANSIERMDPVKTPPAQPQPNKTPLPSSADEVEATHPSVSPKPSDADDYSNLTDLSLNSAGTTRNATRRAVETAERFDATIKSAAGLEKGVEILDELKSSKSKRQPELPSHVGRYEIKRLLGEGTFGKVYEARDPQLDRIVAVKVAKSISGRTQVQRFLREARAAAQLRHPRIIPVYEYGQVEGENIIVYEFVEGQTLKSYLRKNGSIPLDEAVEIVREIAEGLNYAHEQGIIHRDMKPDNVMIDPAGHPHIADFGCARAIEDKTNLTIDGSILGTPMYMSPEQAGGKSNLADGRTDIWSLGVMLFELASGSKPFGGRLSDLLYSICNKDAIPLRKIKPDVPVDIETICNKCLTRNLDSRFATAKILADELGRYQRGEPIVSRRTGPIRRTWMWAKRNQAVASLTAAVAITMLIGTIVSSTFSIQAYLEKQNRATAQLNALTTSEANALPDIFNSLFQFRSTMLPKLKETLATSQANSGQPNPATALSPSQTQRRLRLAILELETNPLLKAQLADEVAADLLLADPGDFYVSRRSLEFRKTQLVDQLWQTANDLSDANTSGRRFRAAAALALFDTQSTEKWDEIAPDVTGYLTSVNEIEASKWLISLNPVRDFLRETMEKAYLAGNDPSDNTPQRAAAILSSMFDDDVEFLVGLVPTATPQQIPYLTAALLKRHSDALAHLEELQKSLETESVGTDSDLPLATRKSNVVTMLIQLADQTQWNQLAQKTDRSTATELIERLGPASTPFETLAIKINQWKLANSDVLSGILLSLGQYKSNQIREAQKRNLLPILIDIFSNHDDARVHSSARWLLQGWEFDDELAECELGLRLAQPDPTKNWHVDLEGNTFALFGPINRFDMGLTEKMAADSVVNFDDIFGETPHRKEIPRRFGICIHEVTVGQFVEFEEDFLSQYVERLKAIERTIEGLKASVDSVDDPAKQQKEKKIQALTRLIKVLEIREIEDQRKRDGRVDLDRQLPVSGVDFFKSLGYCMWLNEKYKIVSGFPSVAELQNYYLQYPLKDFLCEQKHLEQSGYRLPTATEWEFACRGGSETLFPFGTSTTRASHYAWYATNSQAVLHPVGQLKPGNTGLFDVLGNVSEWSLDWYHEKLPKSDNVDQPDLYVDFGPELANHQSDAREFRGGSFKNEVDEVRPTIRFSSSPNRGYPYLGFRLARTYELPTNPKPPSTTSASDSD